MTVFIPLIHLIFFSETLSIFINLISGSYMTYMKNKTYGKVTDPSVPIMNTQNKDPPIQKQNKQ